MRLPCQVEGADGEVENATTVWFRNNLPDVWMNGREPYSWQYEAVWERENITLRVEYRQNQSRFSLKREENVRKEPFPLATSLDV